MDLFCECGGELNKLAPFIERILDTYHELDDIDGNALVSVYAIQDLQSAWDEINAQNEQEG